MTTLHDRLAELADDAPVSLPQPGLWDRGQRYRRRRRLGSAVVAGCVGVVLLLGLAVVTWHRSIPDSRPATGPAGTGLPDRLYQPSPWLPGTAEAGPLGAVALVVQTDRKSLFHTRHDQLAGVSALSGAYRFLDLPDAAPFTGGPQRYAVSPDGRHLAYWVEGQAGRTSRPEVVGVAVYDTSTGQVRTHRIPSDFGLTAQDLVWADDGTLLFGYSTDTDATRVNLRAGPVVAWNLDASTFSPMPGSFGGMVEAAGPGVVLVQSREGFKLLDLRSGTVLRRFQSSEGFVEQVALDPTAQHVAVISGGTDPGAVSIFSADSPPTVVPGSEGTFEVVGWADADHVAVINQGTAPGYHTVLEVLDVRSGEARTLSAFGLAQFTFQDVLAGDLLAQPLVPAVRPPTPVSHRVVAGTLVVVLGGAALALLGWRRRVRP